MKAKFEDLWYEATFFVNHEEVKDPNKISDIKPEDHVHFLFNKRYHFYETPWEIDAKSEIELDFGDRQFEGIGFFKNRTREFIIKSELVEI